MAARKGSGFPFPAQPDPPRISAQEPRKIHQLEADMPECKTEAWKAQISLRIRQNLRSELEQVAAREKRKLGNLGEALLEWGFEQLQTAGSLTDLLKYHLAKRKPPTE